MTKVLALFLISIFSISIMASTKVDLQTQTSIAVISGLDKATYEGKMEPVLKEQLKNCSLCSAKNFTPYDSQGKFDRSQLVTALEQARSTSSFIFLNWNDKSEGNGEIVDELKKISAAGMIVVASAGVAQESQRVLPLAKTVVGQVSSIVIIGELIEKENLLTRSYFGPQMLTALKPPNEYVGQGMSTLFFVSKLATHWGRKNSADWLVHFQNTKTKSRHIWPDIDDFFGR